MAYDKFSNTHSLTWKLVRIAAKTCDLETNSIFIRQVLNKLLLNDNRITKIERRAFMNLDQLRQLNLRGNKLDTISDESFQVSRQE